MKVAGGGTRKMWEAGRRKMEGRVMGAILYAPQERVGALEPGELRRMVKGFQCQKSSISRDRRLGQHALQASREN
jgi:hypothetical protein